MTTKANRELGWHFLPASMELTNGDYRKASVGKTLSIPRGKNPQVCSVGMHASKNPSDAAKFNRGPVLCRVEVWGDIRYGGDKFCGRSRKVLAARLITDKDIGKLEKRVYGTASNLHSVSDRMRIVSVDHPVTFNDWATEIMKTPALVSKPTLTKEVLLALLPPGVVRTRKQLKAALRGTYNITASQSRYGDAIQELADELNNDRDFWVINGFDGCDDGYVTAAKRRR